MSVKTKFFILMLFNVLAYSLIAISAAALSSISMAPDVTVYPSGAPLAIAICWLLFSLPTAVFALRKRRNLSKFLIAFALSTLLFPVPCFFSHPYLCSMITSALR